VSRPACSTGRAFANFDIREFANGSDAFTCSEVLVASAWIRPNTTRWRSVVGVVDDGADEDCDE